MDKEQEQRLQAVADARDKILDRVYKAWRRSVSGGGPGADVQAERSDLQTELEKDFGIEPAVSGEAIMSLISHGYLKRAGETGVRLDHAGVAYCQGRDIGDEPEARVVA
jgi:hypothetical protein